MSGRLVPHEHSNKPGQGELLAGFTFFGGNCWGACGALGLWDAREADQQAVEALHVLGGIREVAAFGQ